MKGNLFKEQETKKFYERELISLGKWIDQNQEGVYDIITDKVPPTYRNSKNLHFTGCLMITFRIPSIQYYN